jgi:4-methyl-5(b-hydroxyethyl)-thiazole monophosphate biosynthesis
LNILNFVAGEFMTKKTAIVILADGFEEIEAITSIDLLRRAGVRVVIAGLESRTVTGSHSVVVEAESILSPSSVLPDALVLPGGPGHRNLLNSATVIELVRNMANTGKLCAAICAAPLVFGKAGILAGRRATCFPGEEKGLVEAIVEDALVVVDGNIITSKGAGTTVPFALQIIAYLVGQDSADTVARAIVYR